MKAVGKILLWLAIVAAVVFATLFLTAKVGKFDSIQDLIAFIIVSLKGTIA